VTAAGATLDDATCLARDHGGMLEHISSLGAQLEVAWQQSATLEPPTAAAEAREVVVAGIGGSATAGDYFAALCRDDAQVPVTVVRGSTLPNYVSEGTLAVICSSSGDTAEALACYDDAWRRGATLVVMTRGGRLAQRAADDGVALYRLHYDAVPRAGLAHGVAPLLRLGTMLGLCSVTSETVTAARAAHEQLARTLGEREPSVRNPAKQLAAALRGRLTFVLAAEHLGPAAVRFKNQLAENGKALAAAAELPEAAHNLVEGLATAAAFRDQIALVTVDSARYPPVLEKQLGSVSAMFAEVGIACHRLETGGGSLLEELVAATAWGDYVSTYVGLLNGEDPTPIPRIQALRQ